MKKKLRSKYVGWVILVTGLLLATIANGQTWKPNPKYINKDSATAKSVQCFGTCKNGARCTRKVKKDSVYCYQHANQK